MPFFVPDDINLWPLTFKVVWARDQKRLQCEVGANSFSGSGDISYTNNKPTDWTDGAKNRTFRSSLCVVIIPFPRCLLVLVVFITN